MPSLRLIRSTVLTVAFATAWLAAGVARSDGPVVGWGDNTWRQATPPPSVDGTTGTASAIAAGSYHSCAIQADTGKVVCWGDNTWGQATPPPSVDGTTGAAIAIAVGASHSCAIHSGIASYVVCWGQNDVGQTTPPPSVNGMTGTAISIAAGGGYSCAIQASDGRVVCWGYNGQGQATPTSANAIIAIAAGWSHSCAIQGAGTGDVFCWGDNVSLQSMTPSDIEGGTAAIAAGQDHSCGIRADTGNVFCWGNIFFPDATPPLYHAETPPPSVDGTDGTATAISAGRYHSCAIQADTGKVVCWGDNRYAQATPPPSVDGTDGTAIDISAGEFHTLALAIKTPEPAGALVSAASLGSLMALARRRRARSPNAA